MKKLTCEMCECTDFLKQEGVFVCQSCGTKYSVEEAKKMMTDGTDEVTTGTAKVVKSAKLDNLYKAARRAKDNADVNQAFKYYEQIVLEDPDSWEATFYVAWFSAMQKHRNGEIGPTISLVENCLDSVFDLIEDIQDYDELKSAADEVAEKVDIIGSLLKDAIDEDYRSNHRDIDRIETEGAMNFLKKQGMFIQLKNERDTREKWLADMHNALKRRQERLTREVGKRRFDEYWATHQPEKTELESEKQSLSEQIAALNEEIAAIPQKTDGYAVMVELQKKVENLASEKKALGLLKLKEKKAVQLQIDSTNNEIAPIQARINAAIKEVQKRISPLQSRIEAIDTELTKPR